MAEKHPYMIELNAGGEKHPMVLTIGNCAIALFREKPDQDYLAILREIEGETVWTNIFDRQEMVYWMGGIALTRKGQKELRDSERNRGSFRYHYGWNPDVIIEDTPSEKEHEAYMDYMTRDLTDEQLKLFMEGPC